MELEIGRIFRAIRKFWWIVAVTAILMAAIGGGISAITTSTYTATSRVIIVPDEVRGLSVINGSAMTLIDIATSTPVLQQVIDELGLDQTVEQLRGKVSVVVQAGTPLLLISTTDSDPELAADISNTVSEKLETRAAEFTLVELQNKESELAFRSDGLGNRIISIDSRIANLTDDVSSEESAELMGLRQERLTLSQEKADLDNSLRGVRSQISRSYSEVSLVEPADIPIEKDGLSAIIMAIIGGFVGAVIGAAIILFIAAKDDTVTSSQRVAQIGSTHILREINSSNLDHDYRMLHQLLGRLSKEFSPDEGGMSLISPNHLRELESIASNSDLPAIERLTIANGIGDDDNQLGVAVRSAGAILAAKLGSTKESELRNAADSMRAVGVRIVGAVVFK